MQRLAYVFLLVLAGCCTSITGIATGWSSTSGTTSGTTTGTGRSECPPASYGVSPGPLTARTSLGAAFGSDGLAYIAGGTIFDGGATALVEVLNPETGTVTVGPSMPSPRSAFTLLASPDRRTLYAIGGLGLDGGTVDPQSFDVGMQTWSALPPLADPDGPVLGTLLADGSLMAILSGITGADAGTSTEILADGGWQPGPEFLAPSPWFSPAAVAPGPVMYVADDQLNVVGWNPTADGGTWRVIGPPPSIVFGNLFDFSFTQAAHFLFVAGGFEVYADCPLTVGNIALDLERPDAGWAPVAAFHSTRDRAAVAVSLDGRLFLFGGEETTRCCGQSTVLSRVYPRGYEAFDLDAGLWEGAPGADGG